jgi:alpha/beta superfamily hydrolase
LLSQTDHAVKRILLVGYSYGSAIACSVADDIEQVIGYTAISYPFGPLTIMLLGYLLDKAKTTKPKLFLIGSNDNFTGVSKFNDRIAKFPEPKELYVFDDIDHFYFGKEIELAQKIDDWIRRTF